ncbi:MAG TPA: hypothetical protein VGD74_01785, partial [Vulgatibacter sp.]
FLAPELRKGVLQSACQMSRTSAGVAASGRKTARKGALVRVWAIFGAEVASMVAPEAFASGLFRLSNLQDVFQI